MTTGRQTRGWGRRVAAWAVALAPLIAGHGLAAQGGGGPPTAGPEVWVEDEGGVRKVIGPEMQPLVAAMLPTGREGVLPDGALITSVDLRDDHIDADVRLAEGDHVVFRLSPRIGRALQGELAHFELRTVQVPPTLSTARLAVLRAAMKALVMKGEGGFAWQEVRAKRTLGRADPGLRAALAELNEALLRGKRGRARELGDALLERWPPRRLELLAAWDVALATLRWGGMERARPLFERIATRFEQALGTGTLPAPVWSRAAAATFVLRGESAARLVLKRCAEQAEGERSGCGLWEVAQVAELLGKTREAAALLDEALGDGESAPLHRLMTRATLAMRAGDMKTELKWTALGARRFPKNVEALLLHASALFRSERFVEAVRVYERVFALDPKRPGVLGHLSGAFNRLGGEARMGKRDPAAYEELVDEMRRRAEEGDVLARFLEAVAVFYRGEFDEAAALFEPLQEELPHEARVWLYGAMAHHWLGDDEEAARLSARAVEVGPEDPDVYYCRSHIVRRRDKAAAVADLKRYIALAEGPGAIRFDDKTDRIRKEIALLEQGIMPPDWDRPDGARPPPPWVWPAGAGALLVAGVWLWRRRRRRRA